MRNYGKTQSAQCFSAMKHYLISLCDSSTNLFFDADKLIYENFILDVCIHCLRYVMKSINDDVVRICGQCKFRPIFSPSVLTLLKTLNALQRSFDLEDDLTSIDLLNEKNGSLVGVVLRERNGLLNKAGDCLILCDMLSLLLGFMEIWKMCLIKDRILNV